MPQFKVLAQQAVLTANRVRLTSKRRLCDPVCIYDIAEEMGVEVRFIDVPSMEALYWKNKNNPLILLSSLRPVGRKHFNCGHELGHHIFGHGTKIDELIDSEDRLYSRSSQEFIANCFSDFLLMPKVSLSHGFQIRNWSVTSVTPLQIYILSGWLGVGYRTLIHHMEVNLKMLSSNQACGLSKTTPQQIRADFLGEPNNGNLWIIDFAWTAKAIDIEVGDLVVLPSKTHSDSKFLNMVKEIKQGCLFQADQPGIGKLSNPHNNWSSFFRISRKNYIGRSKFRHLAEVDDEY